MSGRPRFCVAWVTLTRERAAAARNLRHGHGRAYPPGFREDHDRSFARALDVPLAAREVPPRGRARERIVDAEALQVG